MGKIFCFMGKSASGKDTIFNQVSEDCPNILRITPYTTRPIRDGEIDGVQYHFVDIETYKRMVDDKEVIEARSYQTKYGVWTYFTASKNIDLNNNYMCINTLDGYNSLVKFFGEDKVVPIYIEVEDGIRLERALQREKKEKVPKYFEMCRRFLADEEDFSLDNLMDANINVRFNNTDLVDCIIEIENYINSQMDKDINVLNKNGKKKANM